MHTDDAKYTFSDDLDDAYEYPKWQSLVMHRDSLSCTRIPFMRPLTMYVPYCAGSFTTGDH